MVDIHERIAQKKAEVEAAIKRRDEKAQERQEAYLSEQASQDALARARNELTALRDEALAEMRAPARCAFLVFAGQEYYPSGGWHDLVATSPTLEAAMESISPAMTDESYQWAHIIDRETHEVVATWHEGEGWTNGKPDWWD